MQHGPELQDASITAMPSCIMDGNVFPPVCDVNQDISIADARVISGGESLPQDTTDFVDLSNLQFEKLLSVALLADCARRTCRSPQLL